MASYLSYKHPPKAIEEQIPFKSRSQTTRPQDKPTSTPMSIAPSSSVLGNARLQKKRLVRAQDPDHSMRAPTLASSSAGNRHGTTYPPVVLPTQKSATRIAAKSTRQISSSRLPKLEVAGAVRTPSLASGSSVSTNDSPRSNVLRRKQSSIGGAPGRQYSQSREASPSSQEEMPPLKGVPGGFTDPFNGTVLGISMPPSSSILSRGDALLDNSEHIHDYYNVGPTDILTVPTPQYTLSTTPSTRYSESPGPLSISSTPTSMSSYSPGVALSTKSTMRVRQTSPLQSRPPVVRHKTPDDSNRRQQNGLSLVRESSTSRSSRTTVLTDGPQKREGHAVPRPAAALVRKDHATTNTSSAKVRSQVKPADKTPFFQAPPELAHLADPPLLERPRPRRPSRDGMSEMVGLRGLSPVIQSNLSSVPGTHRRTGSSESTNKSRFGIPKPSSRNPSPSPSIASGLQQHSRVPTRGTTPESLGEVGRRRPSAPQTLPTPPPGPSPSPSKSSRFGLFRRTKTEPSADTPKAEKKLQRRGPAAGTGYEGYGRYAFRGRSGSSGSGNSIGRSASAGTTAESLTQTPTSRKSSMTSTTSAEMDDFFLDRLAPVAIRGTGSSTELCRSPLAMDSGSSLDLPSTERKVKAIPKPSKKSMDDQKPTLLPSAMSAPLRRPSPARRLPPGSRRPSESDEESKRSFIPSLAVRKAARSSKLVETSRTKSTPVDNARSTSKDSNVSDRKDMKSKPKKESNGKTASKPSKMWNFFQRAHAVPSIDLPVAASASTTNKVSAARSKAHYALVDTQAGIDMEDIEQLMNEEDSASEEPAIIAKSAVPILNEPQYQEPQDQEPQDQKPKERLQSMLLPPKPVLSAKVSAMRSPSPKVSLRPDTSHEQAEVIVDTSSHGMYDIGTRPSQPELTPVTDLSPCSSPSRPSTPVDPGTVDATTITAINGMPPTQPGPPATILPARPSRLAQVGRIPQVISSRVEKRHRPSQSFSRPFTTDQKLDSVSYHPMADSIPCLGPTVGPAEPYPVLQGINALSHGSAIASISPAAEESARRSEFFKFPPRKDSEVSYSSSSGIWSFSPTVGTAVVPGYGCPQSEDEIWKEYDDLIDEVLVPSAASAHQQGSSSLRRHPSAEPLPLKTKAALSLSPFAGDEGDLSIPSVHLRRSRLLEVLHSAQSPTSPVSLSDFLQEYGSHNLSVIDPVTGRLSFPSSIRMSTGSVRRHRASSSRSSLPASIGLSARHSRATIKSTSEKDRESASMNRYRDTRLMELAETQSDGLVSMANLRFGALMTSKWLSFGRVLFSPAHYHLKDSDQDRVLVIDGLGRDWSYYCALTYPEATIYDLGPGSSSESASAGDAPEPWSTLRNHHHISHPSLASAFPFPKGFFACVVLRFPPALPSSVHRSVISECKRVLRPGGHLEVCVMDLDLVNMGNRARRAVRSLKVKMQVADEDISLRNISDEIMGSLGRKGFTDCNRCFVGVPVGGKLPGPEDITALSNHNRSGSGAGFTNKPKANIPNADRCQKSEMTFSDLLNKHASTQSQDEGITDMVARVGRWWYSRCYESLVLPEAGEPGAATSGNLLESSIWKDEALIKECEKRGTSFRLLIGYAQKPEVGVRRTVSV